MTDLTNAWITLFLSPLCVALVILLLQQHEKVRSASQDRKSALDEKTKAENVNLQLQEDHRIEIESIKLKHQEEIQRKQREIDQVKALPKIIDFLKSNPDFVEKMKTKGANQSSETTD